MLDFTQPIALVLMGVMGHIDDEHAYPVVRQLLAGLPPASYLALQDGAQASGAFTEAQQGYDDAIPYRLRRPEQIASFFDGLEVLAPGWSPPRAGARNRTSPALRRTWRPSAASAGRRARRAGSREAPGQPSPWPSPFPP